MAAPAAASYPAAFSIDPPERIANWRPLVHWFLAIPHFVVMYLLNILGEVVGVLSWLVIVFTGRLPDSLANVQCMVQRYQLRVGAYALFLVEDYPPFAFTAATADPGDGGRVRVEFQPVLDGRNRVTAFFRILLVIPHAIVLGLAWIAGVLAVLASAIVVLFTGQWPTGLRDFVVGLLRWSTRLNAYLYLLVDEYPPFSTD